MNNKKNKVLVTDVTTIKSVKTLRKNVSKSVYSSKVEEEYSKFESVTTSLASKLIDVCNIAKVNAIIGFVMNDERTPDNYKEVITKCANDVDYLTECATTKDTQSKEFFASAVYGGNISLVAEILNKVYGKSEKSESKRIRKVVQSLLPVYEVEDFEGANINTTKLTIAQIYGAKFALTDAMIQSICNICYYTLKDRKEK